MQELDLFSKIYGAEKVLYTRLPVIHTDSLLEVLKCFTGNFDTINNEEFFGSEMWHETYAVNDGTIVPYDGQIEDSKNCILSGPNIGEANMYAKQPRINCSSKGDYDNIDLDEVVSGNCIVPRVKYIPGNSTLFIENMPKIDGVSFDELYRIVFRKMLSKSSELNLKCTIIRAATIVGLKKIPAIIKELNDDEAIIAMVNANLQREEIFPSERGFSLKMKMDAMRHQGTCRHNVDKLSPLERKTATIVGEGSGLTGRSVQRYIRLTELIPELLDMVDSKRISLVNGVEISYFDKEAQKYIYEYIKDNGSIKPEQILALKEQKNLENMAQYTIISIMNDALPKKKPVKRVSFSEKRLMKYFPEDYPASKCERIITELLEKWRAEMEAQNNV